MTLFTLFGTTVPAGIGGVIGFLVWESWCEPTQTGTFTDAITRSCPVVGDMTQMAFTLTLAGIAGAIGFVVSVVNSNKSSG